MSNLKNTLLGIPRKRNHVDIDTSAHIPGIFARYIRSRVGGVCCKA